MSKKTITIVCMILVAFLPSCRKKSRVEKRSEKIVKAHRARNLQ